MPSLLYGYYPEEEAQYQEAVANPYATGYDPNQEIAEYQAVENYQSPTAAVHADEAYPAPTPTPVTMPDGSTYSGPPPEQGGTTQTTNSQYIAPGAAEAPATYTSAYPNSTASGYNSGNSVADYPVGPSGQMGSARAPLAFNQDTQGVNRGHAQAIAAGQGPSPQGMRWAPSAAESMDIADAVQRDRVRTAMAEDPLVKYTPEGMKVWMHDDPAAFVPGGGGLNVVDDAARSLMLARRSRGLVGNAKAGLDDALTWFQGGRAARVPETPPVPSNPNGAGALYGSSRNGQPDPMAVRGMMPGTSGNFTTTPADDLAARTAALSEGQTAAEMGRRMSGLGSAMGGLRGTPAQRAALYQSGPPYRPPSPAAMGNAVEDAVTTPWGVSSPPPLPGITPAVSTSGAGSTRTVYPTSTAEGVSRLRPPGNITPAAVPQVLAEQNALTTPATRTTPAFGPGSAPSGGMFPSVSNALAQEDLLRMGANPIPGGASSPTMAARGTLPGPRSFPPLASGNVVQNILRTNAPMDDAAARMRSSMGADWDITVAPEVESQFAAAKNAWHPSWGQRWNQRVTQPMAQRTGSAAAGQAVMNALPRGFGGSGANRIMMTGQGTQAANNLAGAVGSMARGGPSRTGSAATAVGALTRVPQPTFPTKRVAAGILGAAGLAAAGLTGQFQNVQMSEPGDPASAETILSKTDPGRLQTQAQRSALAKQAAAAPTGVREGGPRLTPPVGARDGDTRMGPGYDPAMVQRLATKAKATKPQGAQPATATGKAPPKTTASPAREFTVAKREAPHMRTGGRELTHLVNDKGEGIAERDVNGNVAFNADTVKQMQTDGLTDTNGNWTEMAKDIGIIDGKWVGTPAAPSDLQSNWKENVKAWSKNGGKPKEGATADDEGLSNEPLPVTPATGDAAAAGSGATAVSDYGTSGTGGGRSRSSGWVSRGGGGGWGSSGGAGGFSRGGSSGARFSMDGFSGGDESEDPNDYLKDFDGDGRISAKDRMQAMKLAKQASARNKRKRGPGSGRMSGGMSGIPANSPGMTIDFSGMQEGFGNMRAAFENAKAKGKKSS